MAVWATDAWTERSRSKGMARYVGHLLCDHVNQKRIEAGNDWEAWPSQATLAKRANCSDRAIRRALTELKRLGEIEDTGRFVGRGCRVYEITLPDEPRTLPSTLDASVQGQEGEQGEVGRERPGGRTPASTTPDGSVRSGRTPASAEPEGNPETEKPEDEHGSAPSAADVHSPDLQITDQTPSLATAQATQAEPLRQVEVGAEIDQALLADLQSQLLTTKNHGATERAIAALEDQLDTEAEMAVWADRMNSVALVAA